MERTQCIGQICGDGANCFIETFGGRGDDNDPACIVHRALICDFIAYAGASSGDDNDFASEVRDILRAENPREEIVDEPPHVKQEGERYPKRSIAFEIGD